MIDTSGEAGLSLAVVYTLDNPRVSPISQSLDIAAHCRHSVPMIPRDELAVILEVIAEQNEAVSIQGVLVLGMCRCLLQFVISGRS